MQLWPLFWITNLQVSPAQTDTERLKRRHPSSAVEALTAPCAEDMMPACVRSLHAFTHSLLTPAQQADLTPTSQWRLQSGVLLTVTRLQMYLCSSLCLIPFYKTRQKASESWDHVLCFSFLLLLEEGPGWLQTCDVLALTSKHWDYKHAPHCEYNHYIISTFTPKTLCNHDLKNQDKKFP